MLEHSFTEVSPINESNGTSFPGQQIVFRFTVDSSKSWLPYCSYLRLRVKLSKADGSQLTYSDGVSPNMFMCSNLFRDAELRLAGKQISKVNSYVPQVDALLKRMKYSDDLIGKMETDSNFTHPLYKHRQQKVIRNGKDLSKTVYEEYKETDFGGVAAGRFALAADTSVVTYTANGSLASLYDFLQPGDYTRFSLANADPNQADSQPVTGLVTHILTDTTYKMEGSTNSVAKAISLAGSFRRIRFNPSITTSSQFEIIWKPPFSMFQKLQNLPSGSYELVLQSQPSPSYKVRVVESNQSDAASKVASTNFEFDVTDLKMIVCSANTPVKSQSFMVYNTDCQAKQLSNEDSLNQRLFDVNPKTNAITLAFQHLQSDDTRYSKTKFKVGSDKEQNINRFFIQYNGMSLPNPDSDSTKTSTKDFLKQRYIETMVNNGQYLTGTGESYQDWLDRGWYAHYRWPKSDHNSSSTVNINYQFDDATNTRTLLLFNHYMTTVKCTMEHGMVTDVMIS